MASIHSASSGSAAPRNGSGSCGKTLIAERKSP
ncbi:unnamed protein product [Timema podura]|uniref:Uncharacterized protein n=1 Tax=Timema podura TaxID=61482 RepID=A0ABN7PIC3_TIMPD|nr:unnamed protein product [Timema podura]